MPASGLETRLHARLVEGATLLQRGANGEAARLLLDTLREGGGEGPGVADAWRLLGLALRGVGDVAGAERALRRALSLAPGSAPSAYALADFLLAQRRAVEAGEVVRPAAERAPDLHLLSLLAQSLKAQGRYAEALASFEKARALDPDSPVAEYNVASALGDLERFAESEAAVRRSLARGLDAPEAWLVLARALLGQGRNDEAENAYRAVIARRPFEVEAQAELAQLLWMRGGDVARAAEALDAAIAAFPQIQALRLKKAELLQTAGDLDGAYEAVRATVEGPDAEPMMQVIAARFSLWRDPARALRHARLGLALDPDNPIACSTLAEAHLAAGEPAEALPLAEQLHAADPVDQHAISILATCWRLLGDARYERLYDYDRLVRTWRLATPPGWPDLGAYLADLARALGRLHTLRTHPVGQSVRHGSQTSQRLTLAEEPAIKAFFAAVDEPIRAHMTWLGKGDDLVRSRNTGAYRFNGEWSVRLREAGHHADHVHPRGWLSSAFYVATPRAIAAGGQEGWLRFGAPGVPTAPRLEAERLVRPEPGLLALFPSYMWHGTVPFRGDDERLTIAFDVVPV